MSHHPHPSHTPAESSRGDAAVPQDVSMSPDDRTRRRAFKWPARDDTPPHRHSFLYSRSPSPSRSRSCDAKHRRERSVSPPHRQWHASEFGVVVHNDCGWPDGCSVCSQYALHMAQDLVLRTPDLVHARSDCVDRLRANRDYWRTRAHHYQDECERLEEDHDFDRARAASLASQPRHNCPPQPAGAGPSSSSLVSPPPPQSPPLHLTRPRLKRPLLTDRLKEARTMFPVGQGERPHQAFNLYQFEAPLCDDVERAISAGYAPALFGAVPPGVAHLLNTPREIDEVYACAAREDDEGRAHNTKAAQCLITWINRYLADVDRHTRKKPAKNPVAAYALSQWHPPAWMAAKGKSKRKNYKPSVTGLAPQPPPAYEERQAGPIEACEEPIITREPNPAPQVERIPPVVELPTPVAVTIQVTTPTAPVVPLVIDRQDHKKRWHQDRGPKVAPHWGAPLSQWREHVQKYLDVEETSHFLGVLGPLEELAEDKEAALVRQIRGFVLEGYFAPRFCYDSNRHGWRHNLARLFAVAGQYRAI
ncbi:hypothetical protein PISMIDRAFT_20303, partial [Pisolithus microcarpus 441]